MVYKKVRGWTTGRSLPVLNFVKYPSSPPGENGKLALPQLKYQTELKENLIQL